MNARSATFELDIEQRQVEEAVLAIFHTVLFHRSNGKFNYRDSGNLYNIGTMGAVDVKCDFIDLGYVRADCRGLDVDIKKEVEKFCEALKKPDSPSTAQICLEFYQVKRVKWNFQFECFPWELWTIKINLIKLSNEDDRRKWKSTIAHKLSEHIFAVLKILHQADYLPAVPAQPELHFVFDTNYSECQPFRFKITNSIVAESSSSVGSIVKKLLKDSLSFS